MGEGLAREGFTLPYLGLPNINVFACVSPCMCSMSVLLTLPCSVLNFAEQLVTKLIGLIRIVKQNEFARRAIMVIPARLAGFSFT